MEPAFVLVRPSRGVNVGAACRAIKNMGFKDLRVVGPLDAAAPSTRAPAYGAWDVLDAAARPATLPEAVADCQAVVAVSGRDSERAITPRELVARVGGRQGRVALIFGSEASGLDNEELRLCHEVVRIPADAAQPSLNLAQAVLLLAYELRLSRTSESRPPAIDPTVGDSEAVLADLAEGLRAIGYLPQRGPQRILAELRRLLARARPTSRELGLLRGMARQIRWAAKGTSIARPATGDDNDRPPGGGRS